MTDTVPGDRVSGSGNGNGSGFIPVLAAAMHFTDRLIAAAVGKPDWMTGPAPVEVGGFAPSYWYSGLRQNKTPYMKIILECCSLLILIRTMIL